MDKSIIYTDVAIYCPRFKPWARMNWHPLLMDNCIQKWLVDIQQSIAEIDNLLREG
jgi:hypothetical protein